MAFSNNDPVIHEFTSWLMQFDGPYLRNWEHLHKTNDPEAAVCEAHVWKLLTSHEVIVEPYLDGRRRSPDFRCKKDGEQFYVEAACVQAATASRRTTLPDADRIPFQAFNWRGLNRAVFEKCTDKATQFENVAAPGLLVVGTFHSATALSCIDKVVLPMLLHGEPLVAWTADPRTQPRDDSAQQISHLWQAAFLAPSASGPSATRSIISAILVCGFSFSPPRVLGLLNPDPKYPFHRDLLPEVEFCRLTGDFRSGDLSTEWI